MAEPYVVFRFDAGSVENSADFVAFLSQSNIAPSPAAVEAQYQNPVERLVRTLKDNISAMIFSQQRLLLNLFNVKST